MNVEFSDLNNIERNFSGSSFDVIIFDGGCVENLPDLRSLLKDDGFVIALLKTDLAVKKRIKDNPGELFFCHGVRVDKRVDNKNMQEIFQNYAKLRKESVNKLE